MNDIHYQNLGCIKNVKTADFTSSHMKLTKFYGGNIYTDAQFISDFFM